jgi:acyl carrier protein
MLSETQQRGLAVVREVLADQVEELKDDDALANAAIERLGLDSLVKLDLVLQLETAFSTMANENEVAECATIGELVAVIANSSAQA